MGICGKMHYVAEVYETAPPGLPLDTVARACHHRCSALANRRRCRLGHFFPPSRYVLYSAGLLYLVLKRTGQR